MSGSCLMVLASCRVRAGLLASGYDCLLYGRTVIQPYEQAKKSGNLGHGGGAKREKGTKLVNNHRKSRSVARAGNDGTFTTEGYGRRGRRGKLPHLAIGDGSPHGSRAWLRCSSASRTAR